MDEYTLNVDAIEFSYRFFGIISYFFKRSNIIIFGILKGMNDVENENQNIDEQNIEASIIQNYTESELITPLINHEIQMNEQKSRFKNTKCCSSFSCSKIFPWLKYPRPALYKWLIIILIQSFHFYNGKFHFCYGNFHFLKGELGF